MSSRSPDGGEVGEDDARRRRRRWRRSAAAVVIVAAAAAALAATDPFKGNQPSAGGVADNSYPTQLTTIKLQSISSQTPESATLGYAGSYSVALPAGTSAASVSADRTTLQAAETKVAQDEQTLAAAQTAAATQGAATLLEARSTLSLDQATLADARAQLTTDESLGCPAASSATVTTALGSTPPSSSGSPQSGSGSPHPGSSGSPASGTPSGPTGTSDPPSSNTPTTSDPPANGTHGDPAGATGTGATGGGTPSTVAGSTPSTTSPSRSSAGSGATGSGSPTGSSSPGTSTPGTSTPGTSTPGTSTPGTSTPSGAGSSNPADPSAGSATTTTTIPAPVAPGVVLSAPSSVSSSTASFSGTVDPGGVATTYRFVYGTTASYGSEAPAVSLQAGLGAQSVSASVAHLKPGATYLVELEATNAVGTAVSPPQTFSTLQSSCEAEQLVITSDAQAVALAGDTVASDQATAGSTVVQDEQLLASDQQQVSTDEQALALAESQVTNAGSRFTALPLAGQRIVRGESVYELDGRPVPLLYGTVTPYRALYAGASGADVAELQANLIALGFGQGLLADGRFGPATAQAVEAWQEALGVPASGIVSLGDVVVAPGAIRVETVSAVLGQAAQPGGSVLTASSTLRQVTIDLDASQQSEVKVGDPVSITLPDNSTTPGVISSVGTVATAPSSGSGPTGGGTPTLTVEVTPTDPAATGNLDQAPVTVSITTGSVANALVVPVDALLALSGGGYGVEEVTNGVHRIVGVDLGLTDDADGIVQVSGPGLAAGQHVVVPAL